jgi:hypothetical protein
MRDLIYNLAQKICFTQRNDSSKSWTEGGILNLMNVLYCPDDKVKQFWDIIQLPVHLILQTLGKSLVPREVLKSGGECDSYQKKSVDSL